MDAFVRKYQSLVLSVVYMLVGVTLFGYSAVYSTRQVASADADALRAFIEQENKTLKAEEEAQKKKEAGDKPADGAISSLPDFLAHINLISHKTAVIITELTPNREGGLKFDLKIQTDYFTFLRFAAELEALNVSINDLQVRPYDPSKTPPVHAIAFSITPRGNAEPLADERITALKQQVAAQDKRNPFQRFAFNAKTRQVTPEIELTWIYKLTGIGRVGDKRTATINSRDYSADDVLDGMLVTQVESDRVMLSKRTADGTERYVLRFRPAAPKK